MKTPNNETGKPSLKATKITRLTTSIAVAAAVFFVASIMACSTLPYS